VGTFLRLQIPNTIITRLAQEEGFDLFGFSEYTVLTEETQRLTEWLKRRFHAGMNYMSKNIEKRSDPALILPEIKSVISLGIFYKTDDVFPDNPDEGKVSRYAWGKDYHIVIKEKLEAFTSKIVALYPGFIYCFYTDTGPVMDKVWAQRSGIGWMGKHTNIINRDKGSWFFISNIFSNAEFEYSELSEDYCGTCTACIDACPTDAIISEYQLDSSKCISYLTIENKGDIPGKYRDKFNNWIFGCDICQDVCPWNIRFSSLTKEPDFLDTKNKTIKFADLDNLTNSTFMKKYGDSPISRARLKGIRRNAGFISKTLK